MISLCETLKAGYKMRTIGLLSGTGRSSTIEYYNLLNQLTHQELGGHHSAKLLLKSIDYHDMMENYGKNHEVIKSILKTELSELLNLKPEGFIICCNNLHKYYDLIYEQLRPAILIFHAVGLTVQHLAQAGYTKILFLATKFTLEAQKNRKIMSEVLTKVGFVNYPTEYWHWSYGDRYWAYHKQQPFALYGPYP